MRSLTSLSIAALALAGCDSLADRGTEPDALLTLRGTVTVTEDAPAVDEVRLALAWYPGLFNGASGGGGGAAGDGEGGDGTISVSETYFAQGVVTQDIAYQASFPIEYEFAVTAPPPEDALVPWKTEEPDGPRLAHGILLAYDDGNDSGELEPCTEEIGDDPPSCADRVMAASGDARHEGPGDAGEIAVVFVDQPVDFHGVELAAGLNLLTYEASALSYVVLPHDTLIHLELDDDIRLQQLACSVVTDRVQKVTPDPTVTEFHPPAPEAIVECTAADRTAIARYEDCTDCHCASTVYTYALPDGAPLPDGWPCPL